MRAKWIAALLALGLLTGLFCMVAAADEQAEEEQAEQAEQTEEQTTGAFAEYPTLAPPTDATLVQRNPYTPTEDERSWSTEELLGSTTYRSEAVIKLMPEVDEFISLDYKNVDIRELIARIGKVDGRHVLYFAEPVKVTVQAGVVTPMKALEMTLEAADSDLTYMLDEDVIVVGPQSVVTNTFLYTEVGVTKRLSYLTVEDLRALADVQEIEYAFIEPVEGGVHMSATPHNLAHLLLLVEALDLEQNFINADTAPELILEPMELRYITGRQFLTLAEKFGVRAGVVDDVHNEAVVYLTGPEDTITALKRIAAAFDVEGNADLSAKGSTIQAQPYLLSNVSPEEMKQMLENCGIAFNVLDMGDGRSTVYALGGAAETAQAVEIMEQLDEEGARLLVISSGETTKDMTWLRDVIVEETDLRKANFGVTSDLGYGTSCYYLYCIATQEELEQAMPYVTIAQ